MKHVVGKELGVWFLGFRGYWFQSFSVSKFVQSFHITKTNHDFWEILIPYPRSSEILTFLKILFKNELGFFVNYLRTGFGARGRVQESRNHRNEGSRVLPLANRKVISSKLMQNNTTEL